MLKSQYLLTIPYQNARKSFLSCSLNTSNLHNTHLAHRAIISLKRIISCSPLKSSSSQTLENCLEIPNKKTSNINEEALQTQDNLKKKTNDFAPKEVGSDSDIGPVKSLIIGVDPGISGAISFLNITDGSVTVFDMPTYETTVKGKKRNRLDLYRLSSLVRPHSDQVKLALVEAVNARPDDGRASIFAFGFATGALHGVLAALNIPIETVKPEVWKCSMGLSSDKSQSISRAISYFPNAAPRLSRKMDHGRAEAILIAWFASKHLRRVA